MRVWHANEYILNKASFTVSELEYTKRRCMPLAKTCLFDLQMAVLTCPLVWVEWCKPRIQTDLKTLLCCQTFCAWLFPDKWQNESQRIDDWVDDNNIPSQKICYVFCHGKRNHINNSAWYPTQNVWASDNHHLHNCAYLAVWFSLYVSCFQICYQAEV